MKPDIGQGLRSRREYVFGNRNHDGGSVGSSSDMTWRRRSDGHDAWAEDWIPYIHTV